MTNKHYRIVKLEAENLKRLHAVSITPTGNVVEISGDNANGKTSVLDAIWWALAGTRNIQAQPIRQGAEAARIRLDLGDLIVTRRFKRKDADEYTTDVKIEGADGSYFRSPQDMLNALVATITLDPLEFARMPAKQQFDTVRAFVPGIDFDKIENQNRGDFERRTQANRSYEQAKAGAAMIIVRNDLPETVDESALIDVIASAGQHNANIEREREHREQRADGLRLAREKVGEYLAKAQEFRRKAEEMEKAAALLENQTQAEAEIFQSLQPLDKPVDISEAKASLAKAQALNAAIKQNETQRQRKAALEQAVADAAVLSEQLTAQITARNAAKAEAIANAKMPIEGLGIGNGCITLKGLPFDQASDAERLRVSCAIAMKLNAQLRVIRVRDGSLLDDKSMEILAEMAAENDCQIWIETVRAVTDQAVIITDGRVKGAEEVQEVEVKETV